MKKVFNIFSIVSIASIAVLYGFYLGKWAEKEQAKKEILNIALEASIKEEYKTTSLNKETYAWYGVLEYYDMALKSPKEYDIYYKK